MKESRTLPEGTLGVIQNRGRTLFQHLERKNGQQKRTGITKNKELIRQLARRKFLTAEVDIARHNFEVLNKAKAELKECDPDKMHDFNVPFHYEEIIEIEGVELAPDFTFRDRFNKPFYWEHAGAMDIPAYEQRHNNRMRLFRSAGIVPWNNLMVTYELDGALNMPFIESIIRHWVIPRL